MASQTDILDRLPENSRVAVVRLRSLGDCILTTPAITLLERYRPDVHLRIVVEDRFAAIFGARAMRPDVRTLRAFGPRLCINLHGGTRSARLTLLSGARYRAGFDMFRPSWVYNIRIPTAQVVLGVSRRVHTAEHLASAMYHLGVDTSMTVPAASMHTEPGPSPLAPPGDYAVIHPFAATPEKTWPSERFLQIAKHLETVAGLTPVFVGTKTDDFSPFAHYPTAAGAPLAELARLMRDARFFVGNDSGPAHMAAAFRLPQVVVFGPSDAEIWKPWCAANEVLQANDISSIPVERALAAVDRLVLPLLAHLRQRGL